MSFTNLPVFILLFAVIYLVTIYGLLKMAEMQNYGKNVVSHNSEETSNYTKKIS